MKENSLVAVITASSNLNRIKFQAGLGDWASNAIIVEEVSVELNLEFNAEK